MLKLGGTATSVGARQAFHKLKEVVGGANPEARRAVNTQTATQVAKTLSQMKGAAMKVGQMLSMDPNLLPPEVRDALAILQKDAPPMPWATVESQLVAAFGKPVAEVFKTFEATPMGAASIGQVHRAQAMDGTQLAVKVQYPGVAESIDSDVDNLGSLLQMAKVALPQAPVESYLEELRTVLHQEADYTLEAGNLATYGKLLQRFDFVRVPKPFVDLTRPRVLSMEYVDGIKLDEHLMGMEPDERNALASRFLDMFMRMFHVLDAIHADPHPGNFLVDHHGTVVLLDFGCVKSFTPELTTGFANLLRAHWRGDAEALPGLFAALGFVVPPEKKLAPDTMYEYLDIIMRPFIRNQDFDFSTWDVEWKAQRFVLDNPAMMGLSPPRETLFYFRVCAGLKGMLARTDSRVNVYQLARAVDQDLVAMGR